MLPNEKPTFILFVFILSFQLVAAQYSYKAQLPYTIDQYGKPIVKAIVNGKEGTFLFDTGAPMCLTHYFAKKTGIESGKTITFEDSNGQDTHSNTTTIDKIKLGNVTFTGVKTVVFQQGNMVENYGIDGIVGYTLFGDKVLYIDGKKKEITITSSVHNLAEKPTNGLPIIQNSSYLPLFELKLDNNLSEQVMFDMGATPFLEISTNKVKDILAKKAAVLLAKGYGSASFGASGMEHNNEKFRLKIDTLKIGNSRFINVTTINTHGTLSRLGSSILHYGNICIDYTRQMFYFIPTVETAATPPSLYAKEWDVVLTIMHNTLRAGIVWGKLANKIEAGSEVVSINGTRFNTPEAIQKAATDMHLLPGNSATITVKNTKTEKERTYKIRKW